RGCCWLGSPGQAQTRSALRTPHQPAVSVVKLPAIRGAAGARCASGLGLSGRVLAVPLLGRKLPAPRHVAHAVAGILEVRIVAGGIVSIPAILAEHGRLAVAQIGLGTGDR